MAASDAAVERATPPCPAMARRWGMIRLDTVLPRCCCS